MLLVRRACAAVLACACAVAGLAGCSSGRDGICVTPCRIEGIPARAYALEVTTAGRVGWQAPLGPPPPVSGLRLAPLTVGPVAVFAQGDVLYGLRLADGHRLWSRTVSKDIAGMWPWQNLVVVLTQPASGSLPLPVLTGLDASTGQARWRLRVGGSVQGSSPTADGGLAIVMWSNLRGDGAAEVVDLASGRVRWTRPVHSDAVSPVAVGGGAVLFTDDSQLTSYDDRTGHVRWTEALPEPPDDAVWQASTGLVYLTWAAGLGGGQARQVLLSIEAADGRVRWRAAVRFAYTAPPDSLDPSAPGLISVTTSAYSGGTSQDELDPATGRVRWRAVSPYPAIATPAGIVTAPGPGQISLHDTLTGQTLWTASLTSGWQPLAARTGLIYQALPVVPAGSLLIVPEAGPGGSDLLAALSASDGRLAWQVTLPGTPAAPVSAAVSGMLVYTVIPGRVMAP